jgi:hypothetical protein
MIAVVAQTCAGWIDLVAGFRCVFEDNMRIGLYREATFVAKFCLLCKLCEDVCSNATKSHNICPPQKFGGMNVGFALNTAAQSSIVLTELGCHFLVIIFHPTSTATSFDQIYMSSCEDTPHRLSITCLHRHEHVCLLYLLSNKVLPKALMVLDSVAVKSQ